MEPLVCAVDIGNTNTTVGIIDCNRLTCSDSKTFPSKHCVKRIGPSVQQIVSKYTSTCSLPVKISTVIKPFQDDIKQSLSSLSNIGPIGLLSYHSNLPIRINYKKPQLLGTDRIANCLYSLKKYPHESLIIIGAGTAITIDLLSGSGEFMGGFILPGPEMQLNSLHSNTSELPTVQLQRRAIPFPPESTETAITGGVSYGTAGGISFIVQSFLKDYPEISRILSCGGAWNGVKELIDFNYEYMPEMTLVGIGLFEK